MINRHQVCALRFHDDTQCYVFRSSSHNACLLCDDNLSCEPFYVELRICIIILDIASQSRLEKLQTTQQALSHGKIWSRIEQNMHRRILGSFCYGLGHDMLLNFTVYPVDWKGISESNAIKNLYFRRSFRGYSALQHKYCRESHLYRIRFVT